LAGAIAQAQRLRSETKDPTIDARAAEIEATLKQLVQIRKAEAEIEDRRWSDKLRGFLLPWVRSFLPFTLQTPTAPAWRLHGSVISFARICNFICEEVLDCRRFEIVRRMHR